VATAVGGIPEQVEEGQTGFLVPPADSQSLAARLLEVLANPDLRRRLSWFAADSARRRFDLNRQVEAYLAWYHEREFQNEGPQIEGRRVGSAERALS
jgi:glycosyltransferase involved in cell wall biosynthesis